MKIAVINFSGNVGKSTIAHHLLAPRMNNAQIISVESINSDGSQEEAVRGKQFGDLIETISTLDNVVVDIGASNVEDFLSRMAQYRGSHEDFDYFIIPVVSKQKQQRDTISTIDELTDLGVTADRIRIVFNMVEIGDSPKRVFSGIFEYAEAEKSFTLHQDSVIHINDIYGKLRDSKQSISDILNSPLDLKEELKLAKDSEEKLRISRQIGIKRLAAGVTEELDSVFKTLFK